MAWVLRCDANGFGGGWVCCNGSHCTPHTSLSSLMCRWPQHHPHHPTDQKGNLSAAFPGPATLSSLDLATKMALTCCASSAALILVLCHPAPLGTAPTSPNCPLAPLLICPQLASDCVSLCRPKPCTCPHCRFRAHFSLLGGQGLLWPSNDHQFISVAPSQLPSSVSRSATSHHAKSSL